mmetsp:Transcript_55956/g.60559  ORF Transcript_55956/g.60559 Transcript_55956/m.60559 type:complete len:85 (+) Transcript_55956:283-537(+)
MFTKIRIGKQNSRRKSAKLTPVLYTILPVNNDTIQEMVPIWWMSDPAKTDSFFLPPSYKARKMKTVSIIKRRPKIKKEENSRVF